MDGANRAAGSQADVIGPGPAHTGAVGELAFRPATAADVAAIARVVGQAYAMYIPRMGVKPAPMLADYGALVDAGAVTVLEGDSGIEGALVMMEQDGHLFVENVAVSPSAQGRGLGRKLMAYAETVARGRGLPEIRLYTNAKMTENLAFYPKLGFVEEGRRTENGYDRVYFVKHLEGGANPA